ncbi:FGGY family carbohydrate kinase, partial [Escherichia coli]|uniref:FGGY family carbohydrate kinase n=1 Tax=Escherichia coli TaxID=562 RepID=UPI0021BEC12C
QTLWTGHPVSLLRWLKEHEPERYAQIGCVMMTHDYLRWCLTGIPEKLYPLTRQTLWTGHPVSLLRWLKEHEPERYAQIGCVMM